MRSTTEVLLVIVVYGSGGLTNGAADLVSLIGPVGGEQFVDSGEEAVNAGVVLIRERSHLAS